MNTIEEYTDCLNKCNTEDGIASQLVVAVMTICGTLGSPIDLKIVFSKSFKGFEMFYAPGKKSKDEQKSKGSFYNSLGIIYYYMDKNGNKNKISAKIFPNGSIQLAGCRNIETAHEAPKILYNLIKSIPESIKDIDNFKLDNLRIVLINSNFEFKSCILQEKLKEKINENIYDGDENKMWRMAIFQPENYPGVKIRFMPKKLRELYKDNYKKQSYKTEGQIYIFIFRSGKGTITGAKNITDLKEAYDAITNLIRNNQNLLF